MPAHHRAHVFSASLCASNKARLHFSVSLWQLLLRSALAVTCPASTTDTVDMLITGSHAFPLLENALSTCCTLAATFHKSGWHGPCMRSSMCSKEHNIQSSLHKAKDSTAFQFLPWPLHTDPHPLPSFSRLPHTLPHIPDYTQKPGPIPLITLKTHVPYL